MIHESLLAQKGSERVLVVGEGGHTLCVNVKAAEHPALLDYCLHFRLVTAFDRETDR